MFLNSKDKDLIRYIIDLIETESNHWSVRYEEFGKNLMPYQMVYVHGNNKIILTKMPAVWQYEIALRSEDMMTFYSRSPSAFCWLGVERKLKKTIMYYFKKQREQTELEKYLSKHVYPRLKK